jgi:hypothetical protein
VLKIFPSEDVGQREEQECGGVVPVGEQLGELVNGHRGLEGEVVVGEAAALGPPCCSRGVDQRCQVRPGDRRATGLHDGGVHGGAFGDQGADAVVVDTPDLAAPHSGGLLDGLA